MPHDLNPILKQIDFVNRYRTICESYNDFDNGLRGDKKDLYEKSIIKLGYIPKYNSKEEFFEIAEEIGEYGFSFLLTLKDGIIEPILQIKKGNEYFLPSGRWDFIPQKMGVDFDRKKFNLPKYTNIEELEDILKLLFSIYEDIKTAAL